MDEKMEISIALLTERVGNIEKKFMEDVKMINTRIDREVAQVHDLLSKITDKTDYTNTKLNETVISIQRWFIGGVCAVALQIAIAAVQSFLARN